MSRSHHNGIYTNFSAVEIVNKFVMLVEKKLIGSSFPTTILLVYNDATSKNGKYNIDDD